MPRLWATLSSEHAVKVTRSPSAPQVQAQVTNPSCSQTKNCDSNGKRDHAKSRRKQKQGEKGDKGWVPAETGGLGEGGGNGDISGI